MLPSIFDRPRRSLAATAAALVACLLLALPALADPSSKLEKIEAKKEKASAAAAELAADRKVILSKIHTLDVRRQRAETKVETLDDRLAILDNRIFQARRQLTNAQKKMAIVTAELEGVLGRLSDRTSIFADRAVAAYMAGPTAYIDTILSSQTINDVVDATTYYEAALNTDSELVGEIQVLRDDTEIKREIIAEKQAEIASAKRQLEDSRVELASIRDQHAVALAKREAALGEKESILAQVETKKAYYEELEDQLDRESDKIQAIIAAASSSSSGPVASPSGQFTWPANGSLTSPYGYRTHPIFGDTRLHTGIDIGAGYGSAVYAADSGVVTYVGVMSGYGNVIVVDHGGGLSTTYNHLSAYSVGSGQSVGRGSTIGAVGCSGYCTGPHLHFEVRANGHPIDPMPYFQ